MSSAVSITSGYLYGRLVGASCSSQYPSTYGYAWSVNGWYKGSGTSFSDTLDNLYWSVSVSVDVYDENGIWKDGASATFNQSLYYTLSATVDYYEDNIKTTTIPYSTTSLTTDPQVQTITLAAPTASPGTGYVFNGWDVGVPGSQIEIELKYNGNTYSFSGIWYRPIYTNYVYVTYDLNYSGSTPYTSTYSGTSYSTSDNVSVTFDSAPSRSGYRFLYWSVDRSVGNVNAGTTLDLIGSTSGENYTATAVWELITYDVGAIVTYVSNDNNYHTGTVQILNHIYTSQVVNTPNATTTLSHIDIALKPNYADSNWTFSGWTPSQITLTTSYPQIGVSGYWGLNVGAIIQYRTEKDGEQSGILKTETPSDIQYDNSSIIYTLNPPNVPSYSGYEFAWERSTVELAYGSPTITVWGTYTRTTYDIGIRLYYSANGNHYPSSGTVTEERLDYSSSSLTINTPDDNDSIKNSLIPSTSYEEVTWRFSGWDPAQITLTEKDISTGLYPLESILGSWTRELKATLSFEALGEDITNIPSPSSETVRSENYQQSVSFVIPNGPTRSAWTFDKWIKGSNQYSPGDSYSFNATPVSINDGSHDTLSATWKNYNPQITSFSLSAPETGQLITTYNLNANTKWFSYTLQFYDSDNNLRKTISRTSNLKTVTESLNLNDLSFEFYTVQATISFNGNGSTVTRSISAIITFTSYSQLYVYATKDGITKWWIAVPYVYHNSHWVETIPYLYTSNSWNPPP